ncbi:MAG TPA: hypothetical protein VF782_15720 [Allosphingosinicella sp.]|jgi:CHASE1-domain containing sensor protein
MVLAFILVFIAPPLLLAFVAGFVLQKRPIILGIASVAVLAVLLMATSQASLVSMAPFVALVGAIVSGPAVVAALIGSKTRSRFKQEA